MYKKYIKRKVDIVLSLILIILTSPVMIITAILIKIFDKGPVLFVQPRTGLYGKTFQIYKFRTMTVKTLDKDGLELKHNVRVTKIGRVLRITSIDELPQLFNILKGEMSFIGPRPWIPEYYKNFNDKQRERVLVLPGVTGLAQAKGRNGLSIFEKLEYDMEYVNNVSFKRDIKIFLMTLYIVFSRQHAEIVQEEIKEEITKLKKENQIDNSTEFGRV